MAELLLLRSMYNIRPKSVFDYTKPYAAINNAVYITMTSKHHDWLLTNGGASYTLRTETSLGSVYLGDLLSKDPNVWLEADDGVLIMFKLAWF